PPTATPPADVSTLSLHDALPISGKRAARADAHRDPLAAGGGRGDRPGDVEGFAAQRPLVQEPLHPRGGGGQPGVELGDELPADQDRKSTRLNSSHVKISYAVFCL